jgi:type VI secretion system protein ImpK
VKLVDAFIPVLAVVRQFALAPDQDAPAMAARLQPLLAQAQHDALAIGTPEEDLRNALFAVAAWVDETLSTCDWPQAASWQRHLLQRQFFNVTNAGVAFFDRLAKLGDVQADVRADVHADVQEVYVLCLSMGFTGRFGHGGEGDAVRALADIRLRAMRHVLAQASARGLPAAEAAALVFPGVELKAAEGMGTAPRRRFALSRLSVLVLTVPVLVLCGLYLFFFLVLRHEVHDILPLIR